MIKRAAVEVEEDVDIAEEEVEKEAEEQQLAVTEEEDISPVSPILSNFGSFLFCLLPFFFSSLFNTPWGYTNCVLYS